MNSHFVVRTGGEQVSNTSGIEPPVGEILFQRTVSRGNLDIYVSPTTGCVLPLSGKPQIWQKSMLINKSRTIAAVNYSIPSNTDTSKR